MATGDQPRDFLASLRAALVAVTDDQTRDLVAAWVDAWNEVEPDLRATLLELLVAGETITKGQMQRSERLRKVLALIQQQLQTLATDVGVRVTADLQTVIDTAGAAQASIIDSQLPPSAEQLVDLAAWSRVDARQITAIVRRTTEQITSRSKPLADDAYAAVRGELVRGIASGSNPRVTASRMLARTEGEFNGGLSRALTIARTETLDAYREAAALAQAEQADVLIGWMWVADLRPRTCPACLGMHGTIHELSEPGPMGHQNCRCARVPIPKPWSDLGIDIEDDPPPAAAADADAYFESLTKAEQVAILGPGRWDAWNLGLFPREQWAVRHENDGWRDSYQTARVPDLVTKDDARIVPTPKDGVPGALTGPDTPVAGAVTRDKGVKLEKHERITSHRIASLGEDVHWLPNPSDAITPDAVVKRLVWEIKDPQGTTERTIRNNLSEAHKQGSRAIIDLYRTPLRDDLHAVLAAIDAYWAERTTSGGRRLETIWVLPENVGDHFTLEYETWLTKR